MMISTCALLISTSALAASNGQSAISNASSETAKGAGGYDKSQLDQSANACTDFYQYATGGWQKRNPVPPAYSRWGRFQMLNEQNRDVLRSILESAAANRSASKGSSEQKIGDFYASCMRESVEGAGLIALSDELARIERITDRATLQSAFARLNAAGVNAPFQFRSEQDAKNSSEVIGSLIQNGLGMPDRDYYFNDDDRSKTIRAAYVKHVARMLELAGWKASRAAVAAKTIMQIETKLAGASMTTVERRDPSAVYNRVDLDKLASMSPSVSWKDYLRSVGHPEIMAINVNQPLFLREVDRLVTTLPLNDWKAYLRWQLIKSTATALPAALVEENFNFNERTLRGTKEMLPRWKQCVISTDDNLGELVGELYVKKKFPAESKVRMLELIANLVEALRSNLTTSWMGDETRKQATTKLEAFARKIGYPDSWRDYSSLPIDRKSYAQNLLKARRFEFDRTLSKIGREVDRGEWQMSPPTVNAYYDPSLNEIVFPAGILQPPFFDPNADDALNYGGIGAVIGHEVSHGFDDQGSQFDAKGNMTNWWTEADLSNFKSRAECVINQFDAFKVGDLKVNGKLVVGESLADLGGLAIAYEAYQKSIEGKPKATIGGFTPEQRFFLGWAQVWAMNARPEAERLLIATDPHPLARFRVNGPLSNLPAFSSAFGCKANDAMVRPETDRCGLW